MLELEWPLQQNAQEISRYGYSELNTFNIKCHPHFYTGKEAYKSFECHTDVTCPIVRLCFDILLVISLDCIWLARRFTIWSHFVVRALNCLILQAHPSCWPSDSSWRFVWRTQLNCWERVPFVLLGRTVHSKKGKVRTSMHVQVPAGRPAARAASK